MKDVRGGWSACLQFKSLLCEKALFPGDQIKSLPSLLRHVNTAAGEGFYIKDLKYISDGGLPNMRAATVKVSRLCTFCP